MNTNDPQPAVPALSTPELPFDRPLTVPEQLQLRHAAGVIITELNREAMSYRAKLQQTQAALAEQKMELQQAAITITEGAQEIADLRRSLAAVTLERETWQKAALTSNEVERQLRTQRDDIEAQRDSAVQSWFSLASVAEDLRAQLAACQSREAKALEDGKVERRNLLEAFLVTAQKAEADRDQLQAQVGVLRGVLEACGVFTTPLERLKNWNEYKEDASQRRNAALAQPAPAAPDSAKDGL